MENRGVILWRVLNLLLLLLLAALVLGPLAILLWTSLLPSGTALGGAIAPGALSLENYRAAWEQGHFLRAFGNSTLVALSVAALQIATSSLAGYALARLRFRGQRAVLTLVLATLILPFQLLVIPIFLLLKWGHLLNTYGALILPTAASGYGIFLMRQFFLTIPVELEEAAALDGASPWQIIWEIMLPLARPAVTTLLLFTFIGEWNDLFKPLVFTTRPELSTVQLTLASFQEQFTSDWPRLMAAVAIATLPVLVLFFLGQRQFVRGIAATGIKR